MSNKNKIKKLELAAVTPVVSMDPPEIVSLEPTVGLRLVVSATKIALGSSRVETLKERFARRKAEMERELKEIDKQVAEELRMTGEEQGILEELHREIEAKHGISIREYTYSESENVLRRKNPAGRG